MPTLDDYPIKSFDKLRYGDTDRQGHVNNAVFATLLETGRVELIYAHPEGSLAEEGGSFVIARLLVEFKKEIRWPGTVDIGSRVAKVGRSSITLEQAIFQEGTCVATAESILVHFDAATHTSRPLSATALARLHELAAAPTALPAPPSAPTA